jgi:hypothetical protein
MEKLEREPRKREERASAEKARRLQSMRRSLATPAPLGVSPIDPLVPKVPLQGLVCQLIRYCLSLPWCYSDSLTVMVRVLVHFGVYNSLCLVPGEFRPRIHSVFHSTLALGMCPV